MVIKDHIFLQAREEREKYVKKELTTDEEKSKIRHVASQKKIRTDYKKRIKNLKKQLTV